MINYYDGQLTDILPISLKEDASVQAISYALREATRMLMDYAANIYIYCSIDTAPEYILDYLAVELRTQYYDESLDIETKRALVRNTLLWYMTAGTPAAVEELVEIVFGYGEVQEWFEYDGEPYTFRISTETTFNEDNIAYFSEMVKRVKNTRSHLGSVLSHREAELTYYAGANCMSFSKPEPIREGYQLSYETYQDIMTGTESIGFCRPEAIKE